MANEQNQRRKRSISGLTERPNLKAIAEQAKKQYGGEVMVSGSESIPFSHLPTGIFTLDVATLGGWPDGHTGLIFGWEGCIAGSQYLKYIIVDPETGKVRNCKGGTIEKLYERYNGISKHHLSSEKKELKADYYVMSINDDNRVIRNPVQGVVNSGIKDCFVVTTDSGKTIECTEDHKFFIGTGYRKLSDLKVGETVYSHTNTPYRTGDKTVRTSNRFYLKWYYKGSEHIITANNRAGEQAYKYERYFVSKHRLIYEASINNMHVDDCIKLFNSGINELPSWYQTIPDGYHVHHLDENYLNNDIGNLALMEGLTHNKLHAIESQDNLRFVVTEDKITSIVFSGAKATYDIQCYAPFNNFIAGGVVVHNSCKTTTTIKTIAAAQRKYPHLTPVYLDAETHYDKDWFAKNGVNIDNLEVIQNLGAGEAYADMLDAVARSGEVSVIVLDSIPALIPLDDTEKSAEDEIKMAARAKIVSKIYSNLINARQQMIRQGKHPATAILVNQYREKIGAFQQYGTPTTLPGGNAQRFLSYLSLEVKKAKVQEVTDPETGFKVPVANEHGFSIKKPKAGCAFDSGTFIFVRSDLHERCKQGDIDDAATVITYAKKLGMIRGGGKKQTFVMFPDETFAPEGGTKALSFMAMRLVEDPEIYSLTKAVIVAMVRLRNGKDAVPHDNYLCGHTSEEILPIIQRVVEFNDGEVNEDDEA